MKKTSSSRAAEQEAAAAKAAVEARRKRWEETWSKVPTGSVPVTFQYDQADYGPIMLNSAPRKGDFLPGEWVCEDADFELEVMAVFHQTSPRPHVWLEVQPFYDAEEVKIWKSCYFNQAQEVQTREARQEAWRLSGEPSSAQLVSQLAKGPRTRLNDRNGVNGADTANASQTNPASPV